MQADQPDLSRVPGFADTPEPPYFAVIFTSTRTGTDAGYGEVADRLVDLARTMDGFLGAESARDGVGITVSYWRDEAAIAAWRARPEHRAAMERGRREWYAAFATRVCRVERDNAFIARSGTDSI
ncbi:antibiotic biosynthesis monooxygenase [Pseudodesulfovibrio sp.]|uniref:antibiotic biosynthesis monooxygenase family protein n=1 Tax=Pseudodesulfovibrio sp. TaxID=2035812 RepID=UPI002639A508|nr:antibiotic biosynthesis monooxygenase [Pseudodesulfovibrio sp.]MDD3313535.1 antibiotic biosynthesis monooxygenase [Pseudodesulfovibrio sp.]